MPMTQKDYGLVARALREQRRTICAEGAIKLKCIEETAETMAAFFALTHDKFRKDKFMEAVNGEDSND